MKKILLIVFLIFSINSFSQNDKLKELERRKSNLKQEIKVLSDSLELIQLEITKINSEKILDNFKKDPILGIAKKNGKLKDKPDVLGDIVLELEEETPIQILDLINSYYQICIGDNCGYMSEIWVKSNSNLRDFNKLIEQREISKKEEELKEKKEIQKKVSERKRVENKKVDDKMLQKYGKTKFDKMKDGYFWIGMNKEMLIFSIGNPNDINKTVGTWGTHEQWVYNNGLYIYLENGKVTSYQN